MKKYVIAAAGILFLTNSMYGTMPAIELIRAQADQIRHDSTAVSLKDILAQQCKDGAPTHVTINAGQLVKPQQQASSDVNMAENVNEEKVHEVCQRIDRVFESLLWAKQDAFIKDMYFAIASSESDARALLKKKIVEIYPDELFKFLYFVQCLSDEWYQLFDLVQDEQLLQSQSGQIKDRIIQARRYVKTLKHIWSFIDMFFDEE